MGWVSGRSRRRRPDEAPPPQKLEDPLAPVEVGDNHAIVVAYSPVRCPLCNGRATNYGKRGSRRYHQCRECETKFQSVEQLVRVLVCPGRLTQMLFRSRRP